jgi:hypothetical protein
MDIGTFLLTLGLAYGMGVLWYDLLPGQLPDRVWRVAAYPLLGIWVAQALLSPHFANDPIYGGVHLAAACVGSLVAVIVDWIITAARRPAMVWTPERRREVRAAA